MLACTTVNIFYNLRHYGVVPDTLYRLGIVPDEIEQPVLIENPAKLRDPKLLATVLVEPSFLPWVN